MLQWYNNLPLTKLDSTLIHETLQRSEERPSSSAWQSEGFVNLAGWFVSIRPTKEMLENYISNATSQKRRKKDK